MGLDRRLKDRWKTPDGEEVAARVVDRLLTGRSLDQLGVGTHEGRLDLRGLPLPRPLRGPHREVAGLTIRELSGLPEIRGVQLEGIDLSGARLEGLLGYASALRDCRFDQAECRDWRLWAVDVERCSFRRASLRSAMLGGWQDGRGNIFREVDFSGADMRGLISPTATFVDCDFSYARLVKIDFQSSGFIRCRFAGELREVIFWDHGFQTGKPDPNPMQDVDFSDAELPYVEFRRLDLDRVRLPSGGPHVVVQHYRCVLRRAAQALAGDASLFGRRLAVGIEHRTRWAGPGQQVGVFHHEELGKNEAEVAAAIAQLRRCEAECADE